MQRNAMFDEESNLILFKKTKTNEINTNNNNLSINFVYIQFDLCYGSGHSRPNI